MKLKKTLIQHSKWNYISLNRIWECEKKKKKTPLLRNTKANNTEKKGGMKHELIEF